MSADSMSADSMSADSMSAGFHVCRIPCLQIPPSFCKFPDKRKQVEGKDFPCQNSWTKGACRRALLAISPGQREHAEGRSLPEFLDRKWSERWFGLLIGLLKMVWSSNWSSNWSSKDGLVF